MKKEYTNPELTITSFEQEDIIAVSGLKVDSAQTSFSNSVNFSDIDF